MSLAARRLRAGALIALALGTFYLVTVNVALGTGVIEHLVGRVTDRVKLKWDSAYSLWPGHVTVSGFRMQLEDEHTVQIDLAVDHSTADISLAALLHRRFKIDRARATGVSYRMSAKVEAATALESPLRVAAFPHVEGFAFPPIKPDQPPPPLNPAEIDALWQVELHDVEAQMRELWFDEYHYLGPAWVSGSFALEPMKKIWLGPSTLRFDGGSLSAGAHVIAAHLQARVDASIAPVTLLDVEPAAVIGALSSYIGADVRLDDLGFLELYLQDIEVHGGGFLSLDLAVKGGRLTNDSKVRLRLDQLQARAEGFGFSGVTDAVGGVTDAGHLRVGATLSGTLTTPPLGEQPLVLSVDDTAAELLLDSNDLAAPPAFENLSAHVGRATASDATPLTRQAATYVPVIAPAVLGSGPLTVSATATVTPAYALLRVKHSKLGEASLEGAALRSDGKWNGAAAGHFGKLPLGLLLENAQFGYRPFIGAAWLRAELDKAGIQPAP